MRARTLANMIFMMPTPPTASVTMATAINTAVSPFAISAAVVNNSFKSVVL
jgi:hypothetical protein